MGSRNWGGMETMPPHIFQKEMQKPRSAHRGFCNKKKEERKKMKKKEVEINII